MDRTDLSDQFRKSKIHHKSNDLIVMRKSSCLVIKSITVNNFAALFNCMLVDR